jgi:glycosyltransferase involved in cell wall biosynthesis
LQASDHPLVSIIIPTFNHKTYVTDAVESGLNQTYPAVEIIVVDDGSTDGTGEVLRERYGERIRYLYQENRGPAATRNAGTRVARGEFVHYCDADDQLLPSKIERCMAVFRQHPEFGLVYTQCHFVEKDGRTIVPRPQPDLPSGDVFCELLCGPMGNFVPQCTPLIYRQAVLDAEGFNERLRGTEDWDMWLRLAAQHPFGVINEPLALYRILPNAIHTDAVRMAKARLEVIQMMRDHPARERCLDDTAYGQLEAGRHHVLAMAVWQQGQRVEARQNLRVAIRLDPDHSTVRRLYVWFTFFLPVEFAQAMVRIGTLIKKISLTIPRCVYQWSGRRPPPHH